MKHNREAWEKIHERERQWASVRDKVLEAAQCDGLSVRGCAKSPLSSASDGLYLWLDGVKVSPYVAETILRVLREQALLRPMEES
jgi:hypothetical protein